MAYNLLRSMEIFGFDFDTLLISTKITLVLELILIYILLIVESVANDILDHMCPFRDADMQVYQVTLPVP